MNIQQKKEYKEWRKTWHYAISRNKCPEKWVSGRPIKIFGIYLWSLWHVANDNYK